MKKGLALYDTDTTYATRFMEYLKNKKDFEYHLSVFTQKEALKAYLQLHKADILLLGCALEPEYIPANSVKLQCFLEDGGDRSLTDNQLRISKYQPVSQIMNEILAFYRRSTEEEEAIHQNSLVTLMTVYSFRQEPEPFLFAWSIAQLIARNKKVLFIPLELLPVPILDSKVDTGQSLSEFIYYLKENQSTITKLRSLLRYNGTLDCLSGIMHGFDLLSLSQEDITRWISEMKLHMTYSAIIFYVSYYHEASVELLKLSDKIVFPLNASLYDSALMKELERQLEQLGVRLEKDRYETISWVWEQEGKRQDQILSDLSSSNAWIAAEEYLEH